MNIYERKSRRTLEPIKKLSNEYWLKEYPVPWLRDFLDIPEVKAEWEMFLAEKTLTGEYE